MLKEGIDGQKIAKDDKVAYRYTGYYKDGKKFETNEDPGDPIQAATIGKGQTIKCIEEGVIGLTLGAEVDLVCPPEMAYGS